jgi:hypothetical protein
MVGQAPGVPVSCVVCPGGPPEFNFTEWEFKKTIDTGLIFNNNLTINVDVNGNTYLSDAAGNIYKIDYATMTIANLTGGGANSNGISQTQQQSGSGRYFIWADGNFGGQTFQVVQNTVPLFTHDVSVDVVAVTGTRVTPGISSDGEWIAFVGSSAGNDILVIYQGVP